MIRPIIILSTGRSGTTLLMKYLATSQKIICEETYPYETRYLSFLNSLATLFRIKHPALAIDFSRLNKDELPGEELKHLDYPKIFEFGGTEDDINSLSDSVFYELWQVFSTYLKKISGKHKALFYAEKSVGPKLLPRIHHLKPVTMVIIRDPRDIVLSVRAFNKKRGFNAFGWVDNDTVYSYARKLMPSYIYQQRKYLTTLESNENSELGIKYEDLILDTATALRKLGKILNCRFIIEDARIEASLEQHRTTESDKASVSRWKNEMDAETLDLFSTMMGDELRACGYDVP
jgi:hypothetical protein